MRRCLRSQSEDIQARQWVDKAFELVKIPSDQRLVFRKFVDKKLLKRLKEDLNLVNLMIGLITGLQSWDLGLVAGIWTLRLKWVPRCWDFDEGLGIGPRLETGIRQIRFSWCSEGQGCHNSAKKKMIIPRPPANDIWKMVQIRAFPLAKSKSFLPCLRYLEKFDKKKFFFSEKPM